MDLTDYFAQQFPALMAHWPTLKSKFTAKKVSAGTTLLSEGDVATHLYFIISGAARLSHSSAERDITLQFFFENQIVASFESFYLDQPSGFALTCFEDSELLVLTKTDFDWLRQTYPEVEPEITRFVCERFITYRNIFFNQLEQSPVERYQNLVENEPEILDRVPLHLVASYLGITPVSLSRIRTRLK
ncbi:Crp/Fnr family transcriptional regulator [Lactiplantibacillus daoliensis]|uniref:Crp/Fnr family transcriptional regulator n=1 Tax=Lactiplantibacillus daoliensis TaxID=2559916 RepID=A0ABW1UF03_9LACO|nr:Crp/Fnr family transcriptional regulator [Lactiplantibacillus daoliensis]